MNRRMSDTAAPRQAFAVLLSGRIGKPSGTNGWHQWLGLCPFHADKKTGSFYVNIRTGAFKCHSCGANGGSIAALWRHLSATGGL